MLHVLLDARTLLVGRHVQVLRLQSLHGKERVLRRKKLQIQPVSILLSVQSLKGAFDTLRHVSFKGFSNASQSIIHLT